MYNAWTFLTTDSRKAPKPMQQCVDECSTVVAGPGVNHHPRRFVHCDYGWIFVQNLYGKVFGERIQRRRIGRLDSDRLMATQLQRSLCRAICDQNSAVLNPILQAGAGELRKMLLKEMVEAQSGVGGGGLQLEHLSVILNEIRLKPGKSGTRQLWWNDRRDRNEPSTSVARDGREDPV